MATIDGEITRYQNRINREEDELDRLKIAVATTDTKIQCYREFVSLLEDVKATAERGDVQEGEGE